MATRNPAYTFEVATNAPTGIWKVADRTFVDRRLTIGEKRRAANGGDLDFIAAALSLLKVEGDDITVDWIEDCLTEAELGQVATYIVHGPKGPEKPDAAAG